MSSSRVLAVPERPVEPRPREFPIALDGSWRHTKRQRGFLDFEAAEEPPLDDLSGPGSGSVELLERFLDGEYLHGGHTRGGHGAVERNVLHTADLPPRPENDLLSRGGRI